ncbi:hypothetical protein [Altererythrobacter lutimaris]|uniref:GDT1 family protein n=1 Tax=Altererythrobacter lutimaris TaxID=2743979 RepID=A0A850HDL3_9SPHN|nr:hypothetical protein [Altererythrobacter lutimaris]NVE95909.1 hypothetical protein [Altererythrobacter lutimaris]
MEIAIGVFLAAAWAAQVGTARELVAHLATSLGRSSGLLLVALISAILTSAFTAMAGAWFAQQLIGAERAALIAGVLALSAAMLLGNRSLTLAKEPTRSLGAIFLVLLARQALDPARLLIFAGAAMIADPIPAGFGGSIGSAAMLLTAWSVPQQALGKRAALILRVTLAVLALVVAAMVLWIGLNIGA